MTGLRIIVTGGRDYVDGTRVFAALDVLHARTPVGVIVTGGCRGADRLASEWAKARGVKSVVFPAEWGGVGPSAGPKRNQKMVDAGADGAVAFPGGDGTADCTRRCEAAGIKVWRPYG